MRINAAFATLVVALITTAAHAATITIDDFTNDNSGFPLNPTPFADSGLATMVGDVNVNRIVNISDSTGRISSGTLLNITSNTLVFQPDSVTADYDINLNYGAPGSPGPTEMDLEGSSNNSAFQFDFQSLSGSISITNFMVTDSMGGGSLNSGPISIPASTSSFLVPFSTLSIDLGTSADFSKVVEINLSLSANQAAGFTLNSIATVPEPTALGLALWGLCSASLIRSRS